MKMMGGGGDPSNEVIEQGWDMTNRIGERRSMGAFIILGGVFDLPDIVTQAVGARSEDIVKVGA